MALSDLRNRIDELDAEIVRLLRERAEVVLNVRDIKKREGIGVYSAARERQILDRVAELAKGSPFPTKAIERIFINIISATRSLMEDISVSYIGPEYSWSHLACIEQFGGEVRFFPEASLVDVVNKVESGWSDYGVLPARTLPQGFFSATFSSLAESTVEIIAELEVERRLSLLSHSSVLGDIKRIYSCAEAFSESTRWVGTNAVGCELIVVESAARAAKMARGVSQTAVIAPEALYDPAELRILVNGVQNDSNCWTRFVVIGQNSPEPSGRDKTSLVCSLRDRAGALKGILGPFAKREITLLKIESEPVSGHAWDYDFFIDVVGHISDSRLGEAVAELSGMSERLRVLGSYPVVCHS